MRVLTVILFATSCWAGGPFGTWKMNAARSKFIGDPRPKSLIVRFEPHPRGEVFTLDKIAWDGWAVTSSIILYLDGKGREFQSDSCSGTQSSRRVDNRTVEILFNCDSGHWTRFVRRLPPQANELVLDIMGSLPDGRRFERHLILEKQ